jgi:erythromycin esterase-like protein
MQETLERLMEFHGPDARAVVWEHNTHIGDARYTDMARDGMVNVGQLARERWGEDQVALVGFGSYEGSVIAGDAWGAPMRRIPVPPAQRGSFEELLHQNDARDALLLFDPEDEATQETLGQPRGHRAIGVVYHPEREQYGNYVPTVLPRRYDAFLYLDRTTALHPLHLQPRDDHEPPETYPTGDVPTAPR